MAPTQKFPPGAARQGEEGNATAEFVMVSALVVLFFSLVLQIAFALYTKNMLVDAASSGARYGTLYQNSASDALERTRSLLNESLPFGYPADIQVAYSTFQGVQTLEVTVVGPLPLLGPWGLADSLTGKGRAVVQG